MRFLSLICLAFLSVSAAEPQKPNLIFILCDDLAMGDLGAYGQRLIQTPHLDRLAREGTRFEQAYTGASVCAPARASLLTGLHMGHSPIRANRPARREPAEKKAAADHVFAGQMPLPEGTITVAHLLGSRGYATACIGKWGLGMFDTTGSPLKKGFDHFFGYNCQEHAHSYFPRYLYNDDRSFELPGNHGSLASGVGAALGRTYAQNLIADEALRWVRAVQAKPFFLFYALTLPHGRRQIDDLGIYADKPWTQLQKIYAAQVSRLDADVGRLLDLLKKLGLDGKTLVMLAGDNGSSYAPDSEIGRHFDQAMGGRLRGYKRTMYEGGLRNAGIARWPGVVPAGRVTHEPWAFWDFLPTAAELSGARLPAGYQIDGHSLVSFLKGGPAPRRDYFYWELHEGGLGSAQAVRFGQWKAVRNGPRDPIELYDLAADAAESADLAAQQPGLVARAGALLRAARAEDPNWPTRERSRPAGQP